MNPGIWNLSIKCQRLSRRADERIEDTELLVLRLGNYPSRWMKHKLANGMKMLKGNGNTTKLLFSLKGLKMLHQERRGQVKSIVMKHFNFILFHKSGPANKLHANHSLTVL